jgi:hypothetical protein
MVKVKKIHLYKLLGHINITNSTLLQIVKNFKKYFQSEAKRVKNIIAQNMKENGKKKAA